MPDPVRIPAKDGAGFGANILIDRNREGWQLDIDAWRGTSVAILTTAQLADLGRAALALAGDIGLMTSGEDAVVAAAREYADAERDYAETGITRRGSIEPARARRSRARDALRAAIAAYDAASPAGGTAREEREGGT